MNDRAIRHVEGDARRVALVPLGPHGRKGVAIVDGEDLSLLDSLGLSMRWNRHAGTGIVIAPAGNSSGNSVQVSRVILDCGTGENVRYRNGDPTDLRRQNLEINPEGYAIRRDRDFLTPKATKRSWGPEIEHVYE